jgi:FtsP/CotA-like multicopper oxidase with cupredoxin domain
MFDTNGQLFFPNAGINPEHPFWVPEFEGDVICVNGKVWPKLTLADKRYAFWFLNGSNARTYEFSLVDPVTDLPGPAMWVIGTDGGLLDAPVKIDPALAKLVMMPGERYLVMMDFAGFGPGDGPGYSGEWLMRNTAKTPFPAGVAPGGTTTGRIMKFVVDPASTLPDEPFDVAAAATLRGGAGQPPAIENLGAATVNKVRQLTLNEVMGAGGPLAALVNNSKWAGTDRLDFTPIPNSDGSITYYSELPKEGETELWEIVNITADAHPIHLHLVQFQLMNRQRFNVNKYSGDYAAAFGGVYIPEYGPPLAYDQGLVHPVYNVPILGGNPDVGALKKGGRPLYLQGPVKPPLPEEAGWKDTVIMYPGEVTRIMVRWAPTDLPANTPAADAWFPFDPNGGHGYVWHCHIIDHEDNEMMRPDAVIVNWTGSNAPDPADRELVKGDDY